MATKKIAHVLTDEEQIEAIAKRIKRAQGPSLKECIVEGKNNSEAVTAQLQKLFLSLA